MQLCALPDVSLFFRLDACFGEIVPLSDWFMAAYTDCCSSGFKKDRSYAATKVISPASNRASSSGESFSNRLYL